MQSRDYKIPPPPPGRPPLHKFQKKVNNASKAVWPLRKFEKNHFEKNRFEKTQFKNTPKSNNFAKISKISQNSIENHPKTTQISKNSAENFLKSTPNFKKTNDSIDKNNSLNNSNAFNSFNNKQNGNFGLNEGKKSYEKNSTKNIARQNSMSNSAQFNPFSGIPDQNYQFIKSESSAPIPPPVGNKNQYISYNNNNFNNYYIQSPSPYFSHHPNFNAPQNAPHSFQGPQSVNSQQIGQQNFQIPPNYNSPRQIGYSHIKVQGLNNFSSFPINSKNVVPPPPPTIIKNSNNYQNFTNNDQKNQKISKNYQNFSKNHQNNEKNVQNNSFQLFSNSNRLSDSLHNSIGLNKAHEFVQSDQVFFKTTPFNPQSSSHVAKSKPFSVWQNNSHSRTFMKNRKIYTGERLVKSEKDSLEEKKIFSRILLRGKRRPRKMFSDEEVNNLIRGVEMFGEGKWARILQFFDFDDRTAVDLKDKWRNLQKPSSTVKMPKDRRTRLPYTDTECSQLQYGVQIFGHNWVAILRSFSFNPERTPVDLKDKWRNLQIKSGLISPPEKKQRRFLLLDSNNQVFKSVYPRDAALSAAARGYEYIKLLQVGTPRIHVFAGERKLVQRYFGREKGTVWKGRVLKLGMERATVAQLQVAKARFTQQFGAKAAHDIAPNVQIGNDPSKFCEIIKVHDIFTSKRDEKVMDEIRSKKGLAESKYNPSAVDSFYDNEVEHFSKRETKFCDI